MAEAYKVAAIEWHEQAFLASKQEPFATAKNRLKALIFRALEREST